MSGFSSWVLVLALSACGDDGDATMTEPDAGTQVPSQADPDEAELCGETFEACGGDVDGSWAVRTVCFDNADPLLPATQEEDCEDAIRGVSVRAAGGYRFDNGNAESDVAIAIDLDTLWTDACVVSLSGDESETAADICDGLERQYGQADGIAGASCQLQDEGCACMLSSTPSSLASEGSYLVVEDELDLGKAETNPFCVDGDTLRISVTAAGLTGIIVLDRD